MQRRVQVLDLAAHGDGALGGVDLGFVRGDQPLAHPDAHVTAQARVPVALHVTGVALDVDRLVFGVFLRELVEPRVLFRRIAAQRFIGECNRGGSYQK